MVFVFFIGFLEKNRDVLSIDIFVLVYFFENKFLREIFNLESVEIKFGRGIIFKVKVRNLFFKVGFVTVFLGFFGFGRF